MIENVFVNKIEVEKPGELIDTPAEREWEEAFAEALGCTEFITNGLEEAKQDLIEGEENKSVLVWENGNYYIVTCFFTLIGQKMRCHELGEDVEDGLVMLTLAEVDKDNMQGEKHCIEVTDCFESCGWIFNDKPSAEAKYTEIIKSGKNINELMREADYCFDTGYTNLLEGCDEND